MKVLLVLIICLLAAGLAVLLYALRALTVGTPPLTAVQALPARRTRTK